MIPVMNSLDTVYGLTFLFRRDACMPANSTDNHNASVNDDSDTVAIIQPKNKSKEPSLSLMKVIIKHYGHILAAVGYVLWSM